MIAAPADDAVSAEGGEPAPPLEADLCVVGLGAAGLQAATMASRRGLAVVGIDAGPVGGGASGRNGGFLLAGAADFHHRLAARVGSARATTIYERTLEELDRQVELAPEAVQRVGSVRLATSAEEAEDCATQAEAMRRDGLPVEETSGIYGSGLRFPRDAAMHPGRRIAALAGQARVAGVRLLPHHRVTAITEATVGGPTAVVATTRALVAVDGGLEHLLPELAGHVRTARAQMLATAPNAVAPELVPAPMYARFGLDYWQRLQDGRVVVGGARDVGGQDEWTTVDAVTAPVQAALEAILRDRLVVDAPVTHRWSGRLGFTADRLPVCRLIRPGLAVAGGYCGTGNVIGPLAARGALGLLLDGVSGDAELLSPPV